MEQKELELIDIIKTIANFFKSNLKIYIVLVLFGASFGFYKYNSSKNIYLTDVVAKSELLPLELISSEILSINNLVKNRDYDNLTKIFNEELLDSTVIEYLKFSNISSKDMFFQIQIKAASNKNNNEQLINNFNLFLEKNAYISDYISKEKLKTTELIENNIKETKQLQKIQSAFTNDDEKTKKDFTFILDPGTISSQILSLKADRINLTNKLEQLSVYNTVDIIHSEENPSLIKNLFSALLIVCFLGTIMLLGYKFLTL
jgi:hypothetical protein